MSLQLFNTRTRRVEALASADPAEVRMYCCGPTVYDVAHIGNLRTYVFEDVLRRTLELFGYRVRHVMNITDVGHLHERFAQHREMRTRLVTPPQIRQTPSASGN
jgi:cysteinyl-tRNA synthetase